MELDLKRLIRYRVMLQTQTILQYFYKLLMCPTSYWFSYRPTIKITFSFIYNHAVLWN